MNNRRQVPEYFYTQSAAIPCRKTNDRLEILLISSRKKKRWVIPKGVKEPDLSPAASAAKEALEEAGIRGSVSGHPIGHYEYQKWGGTCYVQVHVMVVDTVLDHWEECYRDREWLSLKDAESRLSEPKLRALLRYLPEFLDHESN